MPASEVKAGTRIYVTDTGSRWRTAVTLEDARPRDGHPGEWVVTYQGDFPGVTWPEVFPDGKAALPEPGDGPSPMTWHDRHMDWGI